MYRAGAEAVMRGQLALGMLDTRVGMEHVAPAIPSRAKTSCPQGTVTVFSKEENRLFLSHSRGQGKGREIWGIF